MVRSKSGIGTREHISEVRGVKRSPPVISADSRAAETAEDQLRDIPGRRDFRGEGDKPVKNSGGRAGDEHGADPGRVASPNCCSQNRAYRNATAPATMAAPRSTSSVRRKAAISSVPSLRRNA